MGFRSAFLKHDGPLACHSEIFLHVMDRCIGDEPVEMLLIGVDNGGSKQIWESCLPDGSTVVAVDERDECLSISGVSVGRASDRRWLESVLGNRKFDVIIDSMGHADGSAWPWLKVGGYLVIEHYDPQRVWHLMNAICSDSYTWLPYEEILGIQFYPELVLIEKRNPRVVAYIDILVGDSGDVVDESEYLHRGAKRVVVPEETLENL